MTKTARNTLGLEFKQNLAGFPANSILYEGATGTTYTRGRIAAIAPAGEAASGLISQISNSSTLNAALRAVGVISETKTTTDTDKHINVDSNPLNLYDVSFAGHYDAVGSKTSTAANEINLSVTTSASTQQNDAIGAALYVYEGPGKGDLRTITAQTKGTTPKFTVSGAFSATPTAASKAIVLASYATATGKLTKGVNVGSRGKVDANGKLSVAAAANDGYLNIVALDPDNLKAVVQLIPDKTIYGGILTT